MSMIMVKQQHLHTYKQKLFSPLHNNIFNRRGSSNSCLNDTIFGLHFIRRRNSTNTRKIVGGRSICI